MTPRERLLRSLAAEATDRPPCICTGGMMNMAVGELMELAGAYLPHAHTDSRAMATLARAAYEQGAFENVGVPFCMTVEAEALGAPVELGNREIEPRVTGYVMQTAADWRRLGTMNLAAGRCAVVLQALGLLREECPDVPVIGNLTGPLSVATSLLEPMVFYRALRREPESVHSFLSHVTAQLIRFGQAQLAAGAQVIAIADPSGTGELLGPKHFAAFAVPYLRRLVQALQAQGAEVIVHICGQMKEVFPQMDQIPAQALSFDAVVPMSEARRALPDRVLMGNVSTYALELASPEKIRTLTRVCRRGGANIIAPACGLGMRSPLRNLQAMRAAAEERET